MSKITVTKVQLRFNDMDPMRRVNNSVYAGYLELGRVDFCNRFFSVQTLEDIPFVLVRVEMDILKPAGFQDSLEVHTWVSKIGNTSWDFSAKVVNPHTDTTFVKAKTVQIYFDYRKQTKLPIPDSFRKILESNLINN
jgi:acyl-CoA thioester hydrolase